eukprot:TRINITY_DN6790_c1_g1_i1.p2 TRINITY_DN6790_c1_g1~~TRINITY_DN6790_c1_g1_i1.p2  ORF type:complete len:214 (+),score=54.42 TRINITY_DN6790_c1_g1_i1:80-721(+)
MGSRDGDRDGDSRRARDDDSRRHRDDSRRRRRSPADRGGSRDRRRRDSRDRDDSRGRRRSRGDRREDRFASPDKKELTRRITDFCDVARLSRSCESDLLDVCNEDAVLADGLLSVWDDRVPEGKVRGSLDRLRDLQRHRKPINEFMDRHRIDDRCADVLDGLHPSTALAVVCQVDPQRCNNPNGMIMTLSAKARNRGRLRRHSRSRSRSGGRR